MTARGTALAASALAISLGGIGLALYLSRPKGPPPPPSCTCPSGDVCPNASGTCPSGYTPDPNAPGCCAPTSTGAALFWSIGGSTGPIAIPCTHDCLTPPAAIQVTGLTPNGSLSFFAAYATSNLGQVQCDCTTNPNCASDYGLFCPVDPSCGSACPPPATYQADAFGNFAATWYEASFCCSICFATGNGGCFMAGASPYYIAVMDLTTKTLSNVIAIDIPGYPTYLNDCGCVTNY